MVIPMLNEERYIEECLASVAANGHPHVEILAVDGGSDDATPDIVRRLAASEPSIRLLDNPRRTTPAALNVGLRAAGGDIIIILGAHSRVAPDFVAENVRALQTSDAECVGGPIETVSATPTGDTIALALGSRFGVGNALFRVAQDGSERYVDTVGFGGYRRRVFERLGLFDEALVGNEDEELNYRIISAGGRILLTPRIRSTYYARTTLGGLWRNYFRYGKGKPRVMRRHPGSISLRHVVPATFVTALTGSAVLAVAGVGRWPLLAVGGSYLLAVAHQSLRLARRHGWRHLPLLPAAFACLHFAYGLGMLQGLGGLMERPATPPSLTADAYAQEA